MIFEANTLPEILRKLTRPFTLLDMELQTITEDFGIGFLISPVFSPIQITTKF